MTMQENAIVSLDEKANPEVLKPYYDLICSHIATTDDISFKLLGLVPVMSGTAVFLLSFEGGALGPGATMLIALVGLAITVGIAVWERRNITRCLHLIELAKKVEARLPVPQFGATAGEPRFCGIKLTKRLGETIIYLACMAAWLVPFVGLLER